MDDTDYKKSYKGLIFWIIGYIAIIIFLSTPYFPREDEGLLIRLMLNLTSWGVVLLCYIVYRTEAVYWYNGTSFEEAKNAGSERRREFALRHLQRFSYGAVAYLVFSLVTFGIHLDLDVVIEIVVFLVLFVAAAISTIRIKL